MQFCDCLVQFVTASMHSFINLTKLLYILWMELFWNWRNKKHRSIWSKLEVLTSLKIGRVCLLSLFFPISEFFCKANNTIHSDVLYASKNTIFAHQVYRIFGVILCCMTPQKSISSCGQSIRSAVQKQLRESFNYQQ